MSVSQVAQGEHYFRNVPVLWCWWHRTRHASVIGSHDGFIMDAKMCQNGKNSKLDIFRVPTLGVKVLCFFEVKWKHYVDNIKQRDKSPRKCFSRARSFQPSSWWLTVAMMTTASIFCVEYFRDMCISGALGIYTPDVACSRNSYPWICRYISIW